MVNRALLVLVVSWPNLLGLLLTLFSYIYTYIIHRETDNICTVMSLAAGMLLQYMLHLPCTRLHPFLGSDPHYPLCHPTYHPCPSPSPIPCLLATFKAFNATLYKQSLLDNVLKKLNAASKS